jgi:hypothetical protein
MTAQLTADQASRVADHEPAVGANRPVTIAIVPTKYFSLTI